jgi:hypothetical protein
MLQLIFRIVAHNLLSNVPQSANVPYFVILLLKATAKMYATAIYVTAVTDYGNSQYLFEIIIIIAVITGLGMD